MSLHENWFNGTVPVHPLTVPGGLCLLRNTLTILCCVCVILCLRSPSVAGWKSTSRCVGSRCTLWTHGLTRGWRWWWLCVVAWSLDCPGAFPAPLQRDQRIYTVPVRKNDGAHGELQYGVCDPCAFTPPAREPLPLFIICSSIDRRYNSFSGTLPSQLGMLGDLSSGFTLQHNYFTGSIPRLPPLVMPHLKCVSIAGHTVSRPVISRFLAANSERSTSIQNCFCIPMRCAPTCRYTRYLHVPLVSSIT